MTRRSTITGELLAAWLGRVDYADAWAWQCELHDARVRGDVPDTLMLLEHPPVYTLGRRGLVEDLRYDDAARAARGIELHRATRGGRATYHGPGQLVGYPIVQLDDRYDVGGYCRAVEVAMIRTAADLGVAAGRDERHPGVWVGPNKLGALGVKLAHGVTLHGFAFNVTTDLSMYEGIVPCGIEGRWVTSVAVETGASHPLPAVARVAASHLAEALGRSLAWAPAGALRAAAGKVEPERAGVG